MNILIGIQARSHSIRFPGKIFKEIGGKSLLQWVVDEANEAKKEFPNSMVQVLLPFSDQITKEYCYSHNIQTCAPEVPEDDLIQRYNSAIEIFNMDAAIRLTADCWKLPSSVIETGIGCLNDGYDYVSTTVIRTYPEGFDLQGASRRGWEWLDKHQPKKREHPFIEFDRNRWIRDLFIEEGFKQSQICDTNSIIFEKTSIDTLEEYERAKKEYELD